MSFGERERKRKIELEAGVVGSESIHSGKVPVQSIHPRPATPSAGNLHLKMRQCNHQ